jgi:hypothetical protein
VGTDLDDRIRNIENGSSGPCLERAIEMIEDGGSGLRRLANAWASGDIEELRRLIPLHAALHESHKAGKCAVALYGEQQVNAAIARQTDAFLAAAARALRDNRSTMAVVPMAEIFAPDGYAARLRAMGYEVVEPQ